MKPASKNPPKESIGEAVPQPKKVKLTPVFQFDGAPSTESATPEPAQSNFSGVPAKTSEPVDGLSQPLEESIPFEEERRSYFERRQPRQGIWKGIERRKGQDRRGVGQQAKAVTPSPTDEKTTVVPNDSETPSRRQLFPEWLRVAAWFAAIVTIPGIVFYTRGWEASLAAFGIVTTAFLTHHFFHLNRP